MQERDEEEEEERMSGMKEGREEGLKSESEVNTNATG